MDMGNSMIALPEIDPDEDFLNIPVKKSRFPIITSSQLVTYLTHPELCCYDTVVLADTRFEYEYSGGFIKNATNIVKKEHIIALYNKWETKNVLIVFYCDVFKTRSMHVASIFHNYDSKVNYPNTFFPHIMILNDGYENFYSSHPDLCEKGCIRMRDDFYIRNGELKHQNSNFVSEILYRGKLPRCCSVKFSCPTLGSPFP